MSTIHTITDGRLHRLESSCSRPSQFTFPFCYAPHPLCIDAARRVQDYIDAARLLDGEPGGGKMFGVLVVDDGCGGTAFLAAYSGLLAGRNDWSYFVPPVFDARQPDGYFVMRERQIVDVNSEIGRLAASPVRRRLADELQTIDNEARDGVEAHRLLMDEARRRREQMRREGVDEAQEERLRNESRHMKAELRRIKKRYEERRNEVAAQLGALDERLDSLRRRRRQMSDGLQEWLFRRYVMFNARGEQLPLASIFERHGAGAPPAGTGDCCAPKLLQYAYMRGYKPLCMAEFWWGRPPQGELRRHGHFYPACTGKCGPLLRYMMEGLDVEPNPLEADALGTLTTVYEDDDVVVVDKPHGMLSVPGRDGRCSALTLMCARYGGEGSVLEVHRLDMDTAGLLLMARTAEAQRLLRAQFEARQVKKRYVAVIEGAPDAPDEGTISLPLSADPIDRPRQCVDFVNGRPAVTRYKIVARRADCCLVSLSPLTGRTHQLRVHCAHPDGLACPIRGDRLYGVAGARLCLRAAAISFVHPRTGRVMTFETDHDFDF